MYPSCCMTTNLKTHLFEPRLVKVGTIGHRRWVLRVGTSNAPSSGEDAWSMVLPQVRRVLLALQLYSETTYIWSTSFSWEARPQDKLWAKLENRKSLENS
ncbi:unnamed protein product [Ectocarpus sp. 8 AP-2014]